MKTKKPIRSFLPLMLVIAQSPSFSFSQEVKGGQGTEVNGQLSLMDTVEGLERSARCQWKPMSEIIRGNSVSTEVLKKLSKIHAYAAKAFQSEAARVVVCEAGQFDPHIDAVLQAERGIFRRLNQRLKTIAIRWGQKVFIDTTRKNELSEVDQGMLYIHELAHSFISEDSASKPGHLTPQDSGPITIYDSADAQVFSRRDRLWSFVNSIYQNYKNPIGITREDFSLSITQNGSILPDTDEFWRRSPENYEIALTRTPDRATSEQIRAKVIAISGILWREAKEYLLTSDFKQLEYTLNTYYQPAIEMMRDGKLGWEQALKTYMAQYGLDPLQVLPSGESLLTLAMQNQNKNAVNFLSNYPSQSNDAGVRQRFFQDLIKNRVVVENLDVILSQFDPNEGEYLRKIENGIQVYIGQISFFATAVQEGNLKIAQSFLRSGRVNVESLGQGLRAIVKFSMGNSQEECTPLQQSRRVFMEEMLSVSGFLPNRQDLLAALSAKNEYAANRLLDFVSPGSAELIEFAKSQWANAYERSSLLQKALEKSGEAINSPDGYGNTMIDAAIATRNHVLFDLLVKAGASVFKTTNNEDDKEWTIGRLIENDADAAILKYLSVIEYPGTGIWIHSQRDIAIMRNKLKAKAAIEQAIARARVQN